ncbi:MAG TPA: DUF3375 family protein, partial [Gammaproteobacteria bacterium]|nr:DUF3375 family protein [Gammaproteobacteria bacterium]
RFLDDQAWLENRRIMNILQGIESKTLALRERLFSSSTANEFMFVDAASASVEIPMERPLYTPPLKTHIANIKLQSGDEALDSRALFSQTIIDKTAIAGHIRQSLQVNTQISLMELCRLRPIKQGLAELVAYLELAGDDTDTNRFKFMVDESQEDKISWEVTDDSGVTMHSARLPRVIFLR